MKTRPVISALFLLIVPLFSCKQHSKTPEYKILFLHHSTGDVIWNGNMSSREVKVNLPLLFKQYNKENDNAYIIKKTEFPKVEPYGWNNYPYDYYNIWVKNEGEVPYLEEPTLELLTKEYQVIIFKHCFPVSNIQEDQDSADINSDLKTISNYKLQYLAIRDKLHEFPDTKFILFTGAAQVKSNITIEEAERARNFFKWVVGEWDAPDDNIYLWDLYGLQTEGGLYFLDDYSAAKTDSHPNKEFAGKAVKLLFNRIIDIIETNGAGTELTGVSK